MHPDSSIGEAGAARALEAAVTRHGAAPFARPELGAYRTYGQMLAAIAELARRGARVGVCGRSVQGEPIFWLEFGPPEAKRVSAVISGIHPTEWIGIETHLALLSRLVERPPPGRRVLSVIVANPDGVLRVGENLEARRRRFVRHNARRVDLNRNFPSFWGSFSLARLMLRPLFRGGAGPASEPETRALVSLFKSEMVDRALSLHSFGGVVLYPYGARWRAPLDVDDHRRWARAIAERADGRRPYRAVQSARWVPGFTAPGMELDWFHDQRGALSLLVECSRGGLGLPRTSLAKLLEPFAWFNPAAPKPVAEGISAAIEPFVRGDPLPA